MARRVLRWASAVGLAAGIWAILVLASAAPLAESEAAPPDSSAPDTTTSSTTTVTSTTTTTTVPPFDGWVDPQSVGEPYGETVEGLLTFRGNPTRTFYGRGPVPAEPKVIWRFPDSALCSSSTVAEETTTWCGTGWTGQPAVFSYEERTWVAFGAYSSDVHFVDFLSGKRLRPDFPTGDIIKGSVTIDPDGFPLLYTGSRDNYYRVIAFDRDEPTELWALHASCLLYTSDAADD